MKIRKFALLSLLFAAFFVLSPASVAAKDEWLQVRSKNFFLIGNASEKDIRKVAAKLEQFRETFRLVFGSMNLSASVPTNVVVFKSDSSYKPFKPKRNDGKIDNFVAGYFQSGEDVNYITLSTGGTDADTYGTIFHEYVHFIIDTNFGKSEVPPWFNEGLAEYYQTFEIEEDQKVKLGYPQGNHLALLQQNQLIPLGTFFNISNQALAHNANHSRSIFYAQAWALIHYLVQSGKQEGMGKFLNLTMSNKPADQAFQEAFGIGYAQMEKDLRKYVAQNSYKFHLLTFKNKLLFDTQMQTAPLSDAESNAYLGDLLYHVNRVDDAEPFLRTALTAQPDLSLANATLGMVKMRQEKFDEAKGFLEKAVAQDQKSHVALFRYAYLLSRESRDELGYVSRFDPATAAKMRGLLKKAIAINPGFTESYELLAFVNLVTNEELDEAASFLQKALKYQPGNMRYAMRIAEINLRQDKFKEALALAEKLARTADDPEIRTRATNLVNDIRQRQEMLAQYEAVRKRNEDAQSGSDQVLVRRRPGEEKPTLEQMATATAGAVMRGINQTLRKPLDDEKRIIGRITKIVCANSSVNYSIKADSETLMLTSNDFRELAVTTYVPETGNQEIGCNSTFDYANAVLTYRASATRSQSRGSLVAIEFVPDDFRFIDLKAEPKPPTYVIEEVGPASTDAVSIAERRKAIADAIREALHKAGKGERREIGFIERTECTSNGAFVHIKNETQTFVLANSDPEALYMRAFTAETKSIRMACGMNPVDVPVVFVFKVNTDAKSGVSGELVSLEFVPKGFVLN